MQQHRRGWMTPQNLEKWFGHAVAQNSTEFLEVHVHSIIARNKSWEMYGVIDVLNPNQQQIDEDRRFWEVGISLRDPSDKMMMYVQDHTLTLNAERMEEFATDLLPLTEMAKVLYEDLEPKKRRK